MKKLILFAFAITIYLEMNARTISEDIIKIESVENYVIKNHVSGMVIYFSYNYKNLMQYQKKDSSFVKAKLNVKTYTSLEDAKSIFQEFFTK